MLRLFFYCFVYCASVVFKIGLSICHAVTTQFNRKFKQTNSTKILNLFKYNKSKTWKGLKKIRAFWFALGLFMIFIGMYLTFVGYLTQISISLIFSGVCIAVSGLAYSHFGEGGRQRDLRTLFQAIPRQLQKHRWQARLSCLAFVLSALFTFGLLLYLAARAEHHYIYSASPRDSNIICGDGFAASSRLRLGFCRLYNG